MKYNISCVNRYFPNEILDDQTNLPNKVMCLISLVLLEIVYESSTNNRNNNRNY